METTRVDWNKIPQEVKELTLFRSDSNLTEGQAPHVIKH